MPSFFQCQIIVNYKFFQGAPYRFANTHTEDHKMYLGMIVVYTLPLWTFVLLKDSYRVFIYHLVLLIVKIIFQIFLTHYFSSIISHHISHFTSSLFSLHINYIYTDCCPTVCPPFCSISWYFNNLFFGNMLNFLFNIEFCSARSALGLFRCTLERFVSI